MAETIEISDAEQSQRYLLQSWSLSRSSGSRFEVLQRVIRCVLEIANEGGSIPPLGFIADVMVVLNAAEQQTRDFQQDAAHPNISEDAVVAAAAQIANQIANQFVWSGPAVEATLTRRYDDYVIGKLASDMSLERMADELHKYTERDRDRAIAYVIQQVQRRAAIGGVTIPPAAIKQLQAISAEHIDRAVQTAFSGGYDSQLLQSWDRLIDCVRDLGEMLGPEDLFEMHSGTALSGYGQRIALRQLIQAAEYLGKALPNHCPSPTRRHVAVATNILEEDLYPVGGFTSISNRGTIESMLRSELAYMEQDERPDLFDIKYARDELLYYSRDENQFFRRRISVLFVLDASLTLTRVKDESGHWQRMIYTLASLIVTVRTLTEWLASDSLAFQIVCLSDTTDHPLEDEAELLQLVFREEIAAGHMTIGRLTPSELRVECERQSRQSLCHCVWFTAQPRKNVEDLAANVAPIDWDDSVSRWHPLWTAFDVSQSIPKIAFDRQVVSLEESHDAWREAVATLLRALLVSV